MISSTSKQQLFQPGPSSQETLIQGGLDTSTSSIEVTAAAGGNETDEDKLKDTASAIVLRFVDCTFNSFPHARKIVAVIFENIWVHLKYRKSINESMIIDHS